MIRILMKIKHDDGTDETILVMTDFVTTNADKSTLHVACKSRSLGSRHNFSIDARDEQSASMLMHDMLTAGYVDATDYAAKREN